MPVGVASIVAEVFQAGLVGEQQVRVAVAVDVGGGELADLAVECIQAKRGCAVGKTGAAAIAVTLHAVAGCEEVEPAVVVVVEQVNCSATFGQG